jgi:hypothetical protein
LVTDWDAVVLSSKLRSDGIEFEQYRYQDLAPFLEDKGPVSFISTSSVEALCSSWADATLICRQ